MSHLLPSVFFNLSEFEHAVLFSNCNYVWEALAEVKKYLASQKLGKIEVEVPQGVYLVNPELISIGKGTTLEPGAYIKGPCILGEKCTVRHGAYIRGNFIAGKECVIGHDTEVKHSIFLNEVHAAHFAYVGDCILGNKVNLGAGTKCANLKFDNSTIVINAEGQLLDTCLRKFGAIIGDGSQIGCNAVSNPGTLLGQDVYCYPCTNFGGFIANNHTVKPKEKALIVPNKCRKLSGNK
jgi:filamentous hemagglutinin family protein